MSPRPTQPVRRPRPAAPATPPTEQAPTAAPGSARQSAPARTGSAQSAPARKAAARRAAAPGAGAARAGAATAAGATEAGRPVSGSGRPRPVTPARAAGSSAATGSGTTGSRTTSRTGASAGTSGRPGNLARAGSLARVRTAAAARVRASAARTFARTGAATTVEVDPTLPVAVPGAPAAGASAGVRDGSAGTAAARVPAMHPRYRGRVSTASVRRFAVRARRRRWLSWGPVSVAAGVLALLVLAGWVIWFSPLLAAREVQLVGAVRVTQEEADAAVAPELDRPLSRLDADAVRTRLAVLPEVRSVQVLRVWPSTVEVRVTEREPVAAVPDGSAFALLDADGVQVEKVAEPPSGLPVVSAETVAAGEAALLAAARVLQALPPTLAEQVTGTTAATPDSVVLTLASGARVVWGSPDESARKAEVLQVLLATPAEVYDVAAPGTPVTR